MNLFVVVEAGDHHVTILDGDRFEPLARVPEPLRAARRPQVHTRRALRVLRLARRLDHQIRPLEPEPVAEVRAGLNTRNVAVSGDGRYVMVANYLPHTLVVLDAATSRREDLSRSRTTRQELAVSRRCTTPRRARASWWR